MSKRAMGPMVIVIVSNLINVVVSGAASLGVSDPLRFSSVPVLHAGGGFDLFLITPANQAFVLEASTNLFQWLPIQTNSSPTGIGVFSDPNANLFRYRFYRGKAVP